jgi:hypothetical protein
MSIVNAVTIYAENLQTANIVAGNTSSNITITANSISIQVGNTLTVNSTSIDIANGVAPILNTVINSTSISTSKITLNSVDYTTIAPPTPMVDYQVFTNPAVANYWNKPSWAQANDIVTIQMWGGGGGGSDRKAGGGGGACVIVNKLAGECNSVCNVVVGAGGTYAISPATATAGGNSVFWSNSSFSITAYGGGGASNSKNDAGGGGGGWFGVGLNANTTAGGNGGGPLGGALGGSSTFGGGGSTTGASDAAGSSVYGGGGGAGSGGTVFGNSVYGGAGGHQANQPVAVSIFGGNGGNTTTAATAPGGGGGGQLSGQAGANGARGEVRVWVTPSAIGGDTTARYFVSPNTSTVFEEESVLFTISTVNVSDGTTLYYTLNNSSQAVRSDFTTAVNGSVVINGGSNTFTLTANADGNANETFFMDLRTDSSTGTIVVNSSSATISVPPRSVSYVALASNTTAGNNYTFNNISIGTAKSTRYVVVAVYGQTDNSAEANVVSCSIDGSAATSLVNSKDNGNSKWPMAFYGKSISSGTTANVNITFTGTNDIKDSAIAIWTLYNLDSTTPVATHASVSGGAVEMTYNANDIVIVAAQTDSSTKDILYVNVPSIVDEQFDTAISSPYFKVSGAHRKVSVGSTGTTIDISEEVTNLGLAFR